MTAEQNDDIPTWELIRRLIAEGPDRIAFHVYRRVAAERVPAGTSLPTEALSWLEIAEWAQLEGLLDAEQARLLRHPPPLTSASDNEIDQKADSGVGEPMKSLLGEDTGAKEPPHSRAGAVKERRSAP